MHAPLSILLPVRTGEAVFLPSCLDALIEGLWPGVLRDVTLLDRGAGAEAAEMARACGAVWRDDGAELDRAVADLRGRMVLLLPPQVELDPGWADALRPALMDAAFVPSRLALRVVRQVGGQTGRAGGQMGPGLRGVLALHRGCAAQGWLAPTACGGPSARTRTVVPVGARISGKVLRTTPHLLGPPSALA